MFGDADGTDAGAAAAVRNAKGLVQIQVANIGADVAGAAKTDLGVHVRAIHVNLAAVGMNDVANFADGGFENAVGGRVGDHQRGEIVFVRVGFCAQIGEIDVAIFQAGDRHDFESGHHGARRVGAVRGSRNETDIARGFTARRVIFPDRQEPGVFALRAGVRLERDCGEAGDFGEPRGELVAHFAIAGRLIVRREWMQLRKLRPRDRKHFRRGVQLHRARSERNHRSRERKIARLEPAEITQHLGLGVMGVEDGVGEESGCSMFDV